MKYQHPVGVNNQLPSKWVWSWPHEISTSMPTPSEHLRHELAKQLSPSMPLHRRMPRPGATSGSPGLANTFAVTQRSSSSQARLHYTRCVVPAGTHRWYVPSSSDIRTQSPMSRGVRPASSPNARPSTAFPLWADRTMAQAQAGDHSSIVPSPICSWSSCSAQVSRTTAMSSSGSGPS